MKKLPQRKNHKSMTGKELLNKVVYGTPKPKTPQEQNNDAWKRIVDDKTH